MDPLKDLPKSFAAGETLKYARAHSDFPAADGWALKLYLRGASARDYTAAVSGTDHLFTLPTGADPDVPGGTSNIAAGSYVWEEWAEKVGEGSFVAARGTILIRPNLATASAGALQSAEEKELAIVEAAISGRLTDDMQSYQIAGRAVNMIPIDQLYRIRAQLRQAVAAQRHKGRIETPVRGVFTVPR
jgi:hypothetical protein